MKNISQQLKTFLVSSTAKRFYWNTLTGAIGLLAVFFGEIDFIYAPVIIAILNGATKEINKYNQ